MEKSDEACLGCQDVTVHTVRSRTATAQVQSCDTCGTWSQRPLTGPLAARAGMPPAPDAA